MSLEVWFQKYLTCCVSIDDSTLNQKCFPQHTSCIKTHQPLYGRCIHQTLKLHWAAKYSSQKWRVPFPGWFECGDEWHKWIDRQRGHWGRGTSSYQWQECRFCQLFQRLPERVLGGRVKRRDWSFKKMWECEQKSKRVNLPECGLGTFLWSFWLQPGAFLQECVKDRVRFVFGIESAGSIATL